MEKQYQDYTQAIKVHGNEVARKYIQRINIIKQVRNIDELIRLPSLRCHALKGEREGQWAIKLTGYYRLIITIKGDLLNIAQIEEVSKHYE